MTSAAWADFLRTGRGTLAWRLKIAGWPYEFVTQQSMVDVVGTEPLRLNGLRMKQFSKTEKADLAQGKLEVSGISIEIADVKSGSGLDATYALGRAPSNSTWLTSTIDDSTGTIDVLSTSGFSADDFIWIDSEAIQIGTVASGTQFTGCTRGTLGSLATYHYVDTSSGLRAPEVCDFPRIMRGRRARIYGYNRGDSVTGDGNQVFVGTVSVEPRYDGVKWSLTLDPITSVLEQNLGEDLADPFKPRGISIPNGFAFYVFESSTTAVPSTFDASGTATLVSVPGGFWESQEDFCADVQTALDGATGALSARLRCVSDGPGGYHFEYRTPAASPKGIAILAYASGPATALEAASIQRTEPLFGYEDGGIVTTGAFLGRAVVVVASTDYAIYPADDDQGYGTVPRGRVVPSIGTHGTVIYLDGAATIPTATTAAIVDWNDGADATTHTIDSVDGTARSVTLASSGFPRRDREDTGNHSWTAVNAPSVRLGRTAGANTSIAAVLQTIVDDAPRYGPAGAVPTLESGDLDLSEWASVFDGLPGELATRRTFQFFSPVKLADLVRAELQLAGCYLALDSSGRMVPRVLRLPVDSNVAAVSLGTADIVGWPSYERAGMGLLNQAIVRTGYSPATDKWDQQVIRVRDNIAYNECPTAQRVTIEPRSRYSGTHERESQAELIGTLGRLIGMFASGYRVVSFETGLHVSESVVAGSIVRITSAHVPNTDGSRGISSKAAIVVSREIAYHDARMKLTCLVSAQRLAGYAPAAPVDSQSNVSGDKWSISVDTDYFPSGTTAASWFAVNDRVRVWKHDSTSAGIVVGRVDSVSVNTVVVAFDASWTPGSDSWVLGYDVGSFPVVSGQRVFSFLSDSTGRITFASSNDTPAFQFAP